MLKSIEGFYCDGKVELLEPAPSDAQGKVIVTFLSSAQSISPRGINEEQAAELRHRLSAFADDWDRPEMDVYDAR